MSMNILKKVDSEEQNNKEDKKIDEQIEQSRHNFKIRWSLKKKLFLFVAFLIIALLLTIYFISTRDTRLALISELKKKGGVIAEEKAKSAWVKVFELASKRGSIKGITINEYSELFIELIRKDLHPRDVIYSYIIDKNGTVIIHSEDTERSPADQYARKPFPFPKGVYPYRYIFAVKNFIDNYFGVKEINITEIKKNKLGDLIKNEFYPKLKNTIQIQGKPVTLTAFNNLVYSAFQILKQEKEELLKFLANIRSDLTKLRTQFRNSVNTKKTITLVRKRLDTMIEGQHISVGMLKEYSRSVIRGIKTLPAKQKSAISSVITSMMNFSSGYIVQSYIQTSSGGKEEFLDVSYPIAQKIKGGEIVRFAAEIHIGISLRGVQYTIRDAERKMQWIAFLDLVFGLIMTLLLATYFTNPIKKIVQAMRRVGTGDLETDVKVKNKDEIGLLANNFNEMVEGLREKEKIRNAMNKAVSKEIAEKMLEGDIKLGGERVEVTMLFSDIRGFTSMSEKMQPEEVIEMLNEYMTEMSKIIDAHRGVIDKFVGDEIMAIYGAPVPVTDESGEHIDAYLAVKSAVVMMKKLEELNNERERRGQHKIFIGIGLNTGEVVAGNMGSENRLNYTVLGDNVNLAARLCDKAERMMVLVSESTYEKVMDHVVAKKQPPLKVKGKEKPLNVYSIIDFKE